MSLSHHIRANAVICRRLQEAVQFVTFGRCRKSHNPSRCTWPRLTSANTPSNERVERKCWTFELVNKTGLKDLTPSTKRDAAPYTENTDSTYFTQLEFIDFFYVEIIYPCAAGTLAYFIFILNLHLTGVLQQLMKFRLILLILDDWLQCWVCERQRV